MQTISIDKDFNCEKKYSNFLDDIQKRLPELQLIYQKSFSTDLSISFIITINDENILNIDHIIKKIYSFNWLFDLIT